MSDSNNNTNNNNDGDYEVYCQMCRRGRSQVSDMFKLLDGMYICSDCMHKTMDTMGQFGFSTINPFATGANAQKGTPLGSIFGDLNKQSVEEMKKETGDSSASSDNRDASKDNDGEKNEPGEEASDQDTLPLH